MARTAALGASAFIVTFGYEIARPATESLFLAAYGSKALPWVWLSVAATVVMVVAMYQRLTTRFDLGTLFGLASLISSLCFAVVLLLVATKVGGAVFVLYVLKDVYIVVLIECFWSLSNTVHKLGFARWIYGAYLLLGSLGGALAGYAVGPIAKSEGTLAALSLVVPLYFAFGLFALFVLRKFAAKEGVARREPTGVSEGIRVLLQSKYLTALLALVVVAQTCSSLIDYVYSSMLETTYTDVDTRTHVSGRVYSAIELGSVLLQLLSGAVLRLLGAPAVLVAIPIVLFVPLLSFVAAPTFISMATMKAGGKIFDYSLFRAAKELLYIPLDYAEKTRGKAIVDIFGYRFAKGAASLAVLGLITIDARTMTIYVVLILLGVWVFVGTRVAQGFRNLVSRTQELSENKLID